MSRQDRRIHPFFGKAGDRKRGYGRASHGPDVVDRIEGGDAAVVVWVVNNRSEEVERLHQRQVVSQTVYSRVVGCIKADNQIWIEGLFW